MSPSLSTIIDEGKKKKRGKARSYVFDREGLVGKAEGGRGGQLD